MDSTATQKKVSILEKIQNYPIIQAIRKGLVTLIPILMIGSFVLVLESFPYAPYQSFLAGHSVITKFLHTIYLSTFGMMAVYMTAAIGYHFGLIDCENTQDNASATLLVSVGCYFLLSGAPQLPEEMFGAQGMFLAILSACLGSKLYLFLLYQIKGRFFLVDGADFGLSNAMRVIAPAFATFLIVLGINNTVLWLFHADSIQALFISFMDQIFKHVGKGLLSGMLFSFLSGFLWLFGIHGSNVLEGVATKLFQPPLEENLARIADGLQPSHIITKPFLDVFVLMGGSGTTVCLLLAIFLFSKRKSIRDLAKIAVFPTIFNVNEIVLFGLPIIYNPIFFIPFLCVPLACFLTTYLSMAIGLVPMIENYDLKWTTPIFLSGYQATGSVMGIVIQIVNIIIGVIIYAPFVIKYDKLRLSNANQEYHQMVYDLQESEKSRLPVWITSETNRYGWMGKALASELSGAIKDGQLQLYYQPQHHADGTCIGAEALLRWKHPILGNIYPPLVFKLAEETGQLEEIEQQIVKWALANALELKEDYPKLPLKISVNVTGISIQSKSFEEFLEEQAKQYSLKDLQICLEITEQAALQINDSLQRRFLHIRNLGYTLAVDDFSMGSTSIQYLTGNHFSLLKLDGELVKGILDNERCTEIVSSIVKLSENLQIDVLAEYVSNRQIRDKLEEVGCKMYQGWYYSPAIPFTELKKMVGENQRNEDPF